MLQQSPRAFETDDVAGNSVPAPGTSAHGSLTAWVAGFLAVLISYAGPLAIFVQAAYAGRVPNEELISWIWDISIGAGASGLLLGFVCRRCDCRGEITGRAASPGRGRHPVFCRPQRARPGFPR